MVEDNERLLEKVARQIETCKRCRLCEQATNAVPGGGNAEAEIMFVGEAPGFYEDKLGEPFVGRAGKLLDKLLARIGLTRQDVFITNVVKHRPPDNRDPQPDEISMCEQYLSQQLEIINPKMIVALGRFGMRYFYPEGKISIDRGKPRGLPSGRILYPVYHPAAALRNSNLAKELTLDFLRIPQVLRGEIKVEPLFKELQENKNQIKLI